MGGWRCGYLRRSREGSDYTTINLYFVSHVFQSTLPRRERQQLLTKIAEVNGISIHAPAKGATSGRNRRRHRGPKFQSTLPRRERPIITGLVTLVVLFQSTLPRRERRLSGRHPPGHRGISIHAPVKGATCGSRYHCRQDTISIHIECQIGILGGDKQRVKQLFHSSIAPFR